MREKLIKLIKAGCRDWDFYLSMCIKIGEVPNVGFDEFLADFLLENGGIVGKKEGEQG